MASGQFVTKVGQERLGGRQYEGSRGYPTGGGQPSPHAGVHLERGKRWRPRRVSSKRVRIDWGNEAGVENSLFLSVVWVRG